METSNMRTTLLALLFMIILPSGFAQTSAAQTAVVTLSAAQLQHLHAAPVQLIAAPGSGQFVDVISVAYQYKSGSTAFTVPNGGNLAVDPSAIYPTSANGLLDQASNTVAVAGKSTQTLYQSAVENKPVMVANDASAEWTGGDGTLTVTVAYRIVALQ